MNMLQAIGNHFSNVGYLTDVRKNRLEIWATDLMCVKASIDQSTLQLAIHYTHYPDLPFDQVDIDLTNSTAISEMEKYVYSYANIDAFGTHKANHGKVIPVAAESSVSSQYAIIAPKLFQCY